MSIKKLKSGFLIKKKYTSILVLSLPLIFCFAKIASANSEAYSVFKQGLHFEKSNMVFQARDAFKIAILLDPMNRGYKEHFGWFLHYHNFSQEAVEVFAQLLKMPGEKGFIYRGLGWNNMITGRIQEAINAYRRVFTLPPDGSSLQVIVGAIREKLAEENRIKIASLLKTLEKDPENIGAKKDLFETYTSVGELKSAITLGENIKKQDPEDWVFSLKFARALLWNNEKIRSEAEYRRILEHSPDSAFVWFELGRFLSDDGRLDEAQGALKKSLGFYPNAVKTRKELAEVFAKKKLEADAINTAAAMDGSGHETLDQSLAMARVLHFTGRLKEAKKVYHQVLQDYPYNNDALWGLAETSLYLEEFADTKEAIEKWENGLPDGRLTVQKNLYGRYTAPTAGIRNEYYENSSEFSRYSAGADVKLFVDPKTRLGVGYYASWFGQKRYEDISRHSIHAEAGSVIFKGSRISGRLIGNLYDNNVNNLNGVISLQLDPSEKITTVFTYEHIDIIDKEQPFLGNPIYNYVVTIGAVALNIRTNDYSVYLKYRPSEKIYLSGESVYGDYTDGNRKRSYMLESGYIFKKTPLIRLSYNYFYLDYQDPAPVYIENLQRQSAYYDPINLEVHTLRLQYKNESNRWLSYGAEAAVSFIPKNNGVSNSLFVFGAFKFGKRHRLRLDGRVFYQDKGIDRVGETGYFDAENVTLSYEHDF